MSTGHTPRPEPSGARIADPDEGRDLAAGYPDAVPGLRNIGVLHTSLTGVHSRRTCAPTTVETLAARRYDYWALGHVHQRRTIAVGEE